MSRVKNVIEAQRELDEANLGRLGTALVLLELVRERIDVLSMRGVGVSTLKPAASDIQRIAELIRKTQQSL